MNTQPSLSFFKIILCTFVCFILIEGVLHIPLVENKFESIMFNEVAHKNNLLKQSSQFTERSPDVLVFGTSRTRHGFSPDYFQAASDAPVKSFNMGASAAPPILHRLWLDHHIRHHGKPKMVLLELMFKVDDHALQDQQYTYFMRALASDNPLHFVKTLLQAPISRDEKQSIFLVTYSNLYRFRNYFKFNKLIKALGEQPSVKYKNWQNPTGWVPERFPFDTEKAEKQNQEFQQRVLTYSEPASLADTRYFLEYAKSQDIPVVLFQWPVTQEYNTLYRQGKAYQKFLATLRDIQQEYGVQFIDLNERYASKMDHRCFTDSHHLNEQGSIWMTQALAHELCSLNHCLGQSNRQLSQVSSQNPSK
jgi:hypothetical protein